MKLNLTSIKSQVIVGLFVLAFFILNCIGWSLRRFDLLSLTWATSGILSLVIRGFIARFVDKLNLAPGMFSERVPILWGIGALLFALALAIN
jgi:hypothetical protein